jgi:nucleoside-diphosphate-sugar epimerase
MNLSPVLITGGAGFIGRNIARHLTGRGQEVRLVDNLAVEPVAPPPPGLDVRDVRALTVADLTDTPVVVHLAALKSVPGSFDNLENLTHNVGVDHHIIHTFVNSPARRLVLAGSCEVYGARPHPLSENDQWQPLSPYATGKCATEMLADAYRRLHPEKEITVVRFFNVYGPDEGAEAVVPSFIDSLLDEQVCRVQGSGTQERDLSHIDDTCEMLLSVIDSDTVVPVINLGSAASSRIIDIAHTLIEIAGGGAVEHGAERPNEIPRFLADMALYEKLYDSRPSRPLGAGLRDSFIDRAKRRRAGTARTSLVPVPAAEAAADLVAR